MVWQRIYDEASEFKGLSLPLLKAAVIHTVGLKPWESKTVRGKAWKSVEITKSNKKGETTYSFAFKDSIYLE